MWLKSVEEQTDQKINWGWAEREKGEIRGVVQHCVQLILLLIKQTSDNIRQVFGEKLEDEDEERKDKKAQQDRVEWHTVPVYNTR